MKILEAFALLCLAGAPARAQLTSYAAPRSTSTEVAVDTAPTKLDQVEDEVLRESVPLQAIPEPDTSEDETARLDALYDGSQAGGAEEDALAETPDPHPSAPAPIQAGPIPSTDWNPVHEDFLHLEPEAAAVLPAGALRVDMNTARTNSMQGVSPADGGTGLLHAETTREDVNIHAGLGSGLEAALLVPLYQRTDPIMDPVAYFIEKNAQAFNPVRLRYEGTPYQFSLQIPGQGLMKTPDGAFGPGDIAFTLKQTLLEETKELPGISLRAGLKLPTGYEPYGFSSGTVDAAVGLAVQKALFPWLIAYGNLEAATPLDPTPYMHAYRSGSLSLETLLSRRLSLVTQLDSYTSPYHDTGDSMLDGRDDLFLAALDFTARALGQDTTLRVFVTENFLIGGGEFEGQADDFTVGSTVTADILP